MTIAKHPKTIVRHTGFSGSQVVQSQQCSALRLHKGNPQASLVLHPSQRMEYSCQPQTLSFGVVGKRERGSH